MTRWVVDASAVRHSGSLTHHEGLLPALDARLHDEDGTILASPILAAKLDGRLRTADIEVVDVPLGVGRFAGLNLVVRRRIRRIGPDAVLGGHHAPLALGAPFVLRLTDAHLVDPVGLRRVLPFYRYTQRLGWWVKRAAFRRSARGAGAILCATDAVRDQLLRELPDLDPERVFTAAYGPSPLLRAGARHGGAKGTRLLTMHASPRKNVEGILDALARPELAHWSLTVLADLERPQNPYTRFLARRIMELGLEGRVHSAGYISDRDRLLRCMLDHDILVVPSRIESWSHTVVEALGLGMPVIASDIPCHREVSGGAAWLVPVDEPDRLAAAVLEIAAGGDAVSDRVRRGVDVVSEYSWSSYAEGALAALRHAAGR